jgi:hypothetical protein
MSAKFKQEDCVIPSYYCGKSEVVPEDTVLQRYTRKGTPFECLSKGFGAGMATERLKHLPALSLQRVKYVGDLYDKKFQKEGIRSMNDLIVFVESHKVSEIDTLLKKILTKKNKTLDLRAYNSVLLALHKKDDLLKIPECQKIKNSDIS